MPLFSFLRRSSSQSNDQQKTPFQSIEYFHNEDLEYRAYEGHEESIWHKSPKEIDSHFQALYREFYNEALTSDLLVRVGGKGIHANMSMLHAMSVVWREMTREDRGIGEQNDVTPSAPCKVALPPNDAKPATALDEDGSSVEAGSSEALDMRATSTAPTIAPLSSNLFLKELTSQLREQISRTTPHPTWTIPQQHATHFLTVLQYLYGISDSLPLNASNCLPLLELSHNYGFTIIRHESLEYAWNHIDQLNWLDLFIHCIQTREEKLLRKMMHYFEPARHLEALVGALPWESAQKVLKSSNFSFSEEEFFTAAQKMVRSKRFSPQQRKELFACIRLPQLSSSVLTEQIAPLVAKGVVPEEDYLSSLRFHVNPWQFSKSKELCFHTRRPRFFVAADSTNLVQISDSGLTASAHKHYPKVYFPLSACGVSKVTFKLWCGAPASISIGLADERIFYDPRHSHFSSSTSVGLNAFTTHHYRFIVNFEENHMALEVVNPVTKDVETTYTAFPKRPSEFGKGLCMVVMFSCCTGTISILPFD